MMMGLSAASSVMPSNDIFLAYPDPPYTQGVLEREKKLSNIN